jgi:putative restriction endonuclease
VSAGREVKAFVGITDNEWFKFLSHRPDPDEVNFWTPSGKRAATIELGHPVLFKLHSPLNFIVGGGFFAHFSRLPVSLVWDVFGEQNGVETYEHMGARIEKCSVPRFEWTPKFVT